MWQNVCVSEPKDSDRTCVVTVDTAKHFIIVIEIDYWFLFIRQHKLWNVAQLRIATVTRFSWYFAANTTVLSRCGLIRNI